MIKTDKPRTHWQIWAADAQNGDQKSYYALLKDVDLYTRRYLKKDLTNEDWAQDITQNVLVSIHKSLHTYAPERPFKSWLNAIINFRRADYLRKYYRTQNHKQTSLDNPDFINNHVTNMAHTGEYSDIEKALSHLSAKQRDIVKLMKIEGYTAKDVAQKMNMSESAVKVSAHRALKQIKHDLG